MNNNKKSKFYESEGLDLPLMYVYLAGYMSGEKLKQCIAWRKEIRHFYKNWKDSSRAYPFIFLDPFNGKELETIDSKGLTSSVPSKAIVYGDYKSVKKADILVVNLDIFGADRPSIGTYCEMAWAWQMKKPIITIAKNKDILKKHPFIQEFTTIFVENVDELLEKKHLNTFYKRIAGAIY